MSAIRCEASSSASLSPAETPSLSASDRFWLTFHLPSIRAISISMPTMPLSWAATKGAGASLTAQGSGRKFLLGLRHGGDLLPQPVRIVLDPDAAMGLHDGVVPGRHHLAVLALGRVPGRGDVGLGTLEDDERFLRGVEILPLGVGAGQMGLERPHGGGGGIQHEGEGVGHEPRAAERDQQPKRVGLDEGVLDREAILAEMRRLIHGDSGAIAPAC